MHLHQRKIQEAPQDRPAPPGATKARRIKSVRDKLRTKYETQVAHAQKKLEATDESSLKSELSDSDDDDEVQGRRILGLPTKLQGPDP